MCFYAISGQKTGVTKHGGRQAPNLDMLPILVGKIKKINRKNEE